MLVPVVITAKIMLTILFPNSIQIKRLKIVFKWIFLILVLQATLREEKKLRVENAKLKKEIEELKQELIQAEIKNGGEDENVGCSVYNDRVISSSYPLSLPQCIPPIQEEMI